MRRKAVNKVRKEIEKKMEELQEKANEIRDHLEAFIDEVYDDEESYMMDRSERWMESDNGMEFEERLDALRDYEDFFNELETLEGNSDGYIDTFEY